MRRKDERLIVSEVKKSSRFLPATRLQLGYYLWLLAGEVIEVSGEILIPEERKRGGRMWFGCSGTPYARFQASSWWSETALSSSAAKV